MNFNLNAKATTKIEIEYDNPLNDAAWALHEQISQYSEINGHLFNNLKSCLKAAIEEYLAKSLEENKE